MNEDQRENLRMIQERWLETLTVLGDDENEFPNAEYLREVIVERYGEIPHAARHALANGEDVFFAGEVKRVPNSPNSIPQNFDYATPLVLRYDIGGNVYWYIYNNINNAVVIDDEGGTHSFNLRDVIILHDNIGLVVAL